MIEDPFKYLALAGHSAPSADNSQPWTFVRKGEQLLITYDSKRIRGSSFSAKDPATLLSFGALIENIEQAAEYASMLIDIDYLEPANEPDGLGIAVTLRKTMGVKTPVTPPLFDRHTNRFSYTTDPMPNECQLQLEGMKEGAARIILLSHPARVGKIADCIQLASRTRFRTQDVHEWLAKSLRFTAGAADTGDGLDVRTLDLPPGGLQLLRFIGDWSRMRKLNKLGLFKLLARIDSAPVRQAPAIACLVAPSDWKSTLNAGRLLSRAWIYLNSNSIAVHPYYVISDQINRLANGKIPKAMTHEIEKLRENCVQLLDLKNGETLHMVLRAGYPTQQPIRSLRLPISAVYKD